MASYLRLLASVRSWLIFKHRSFAARATKPPDAVLRRPKKPMGAFQLYFQEVYRDVSGRYPGMAMAELIQIVAEDYRNLDDAIKDAYKEEAHYAMEEFQKTMEVYRSSLTPQDKQELIDWQKEKTKSRKKREEKAEKVAMQTPKEPARPFVLFANEYRRQIDPKDHLKGISAAQSAKEAAVVWKEMTEDEKQVYQDKFKTDTERYNREMIAFKGIHSQDKSQGIIEIPSAFDLYVKDQVESGMVTYSEGQLKSQVLEEAFVTWKTLSLAEQEVYIRKAKRVKTSSEAKTERQSGPRVVLNPESDLIQS